MQLLYADTGRLRREKHGLVRILINGRNEGKKQHYDAQASEPLDNAPPEKYAMRLEINIIHDGGSCSGKARHRLKKSICDVFYRTREDEWKHAENSEQHPCHCHHDKRVLHGETVDLHIAIIIFLSLLLSRRKQYEPKDSGHHSGSKHGKNIFFSGGDIIIESHHRSYQHEKRLDKNKNAINLSLHIPFILWQK